MRSLPRLTSRCLPNCGLICIPPGRLFIINNLLLSVATRFGFLHIGESLMNVRRAAASRVRVRVRVWRTGTCRILGVIVAC